MCGIVGFISKEKQLNVLNNMLKIQSYRGPDDRGVYFDLKNGVHLGHNRLSILDLTNAGHQPMVSKCGNYVIAYNGEVYNFKEIKTTLSKKGYKFNSNSDTEVVLYSLIEWGIEAVHKFIGMFAIAFYDKINSKLFLIRDRAGIKPLYYYFDDTFMFSSEIKSFHQHPKFKKEINYDILSYYFRLGYIPAPFSIFKNCFKLEAGHYLEFDIKNNNFKINKYWDIEKFYRKEKLNLSENEILKELEEILDSAINYRMIADVPVGVFLSGGYDSSFVTTILAKKNNKKINTFTIGFDNPKYNEAKHAKEIAKFLNTNHTEYYMKKEDAFELIEYLPFLYDEPFGDSSALPTILVSKLAKQKVKVVLSADGGDEIFCGYSKYKFLNNILSLKNYKKKLLQIGLNLLNENIVEKFNLMLPQKLQQTNIKEKFLKFKRAISASNINEIFLNASSYLSENEIKQYLKIYDKKVFNKFYKIDLDILDYMMMVDYKTFMVDDVLVKVDRATMGVSIEGREPLLDHRIAEFMATVPKEIKCKNNQSKYLLRQILYKYIPKDLIDKPKSGFQIPLNEWLRDDLRYLIEKYINKNVLDKNIFEIEKVLKIKEDFLKGKNNYHSFLWFIIIYEMWRENWLK